MTRALRALLAIVVVWAAPSTAHGGVRRVAILIGNNTGFADEQALRYAERDVAKLAAVLRDLGGFHAEDVISLVGQNPATARRVLISINDQIRSDGDQAMLFVYFSGHADATGLHLGREAFAHDEILRLVRGSAATVRLLVIDSCRSGVVTRRKGGRSAPVFALNLDDTLASEGAIFLSASSGDEDAQESDDLQGSFFTHFLVSGLLGAADEDRDGHVELDEAYRYAYANTLRATSSTAAGTQHPTFRYDVRGQGKIVITSLGAARGARTMVTVPAGRDVLVFEESEHGPVIAEVGKQAPRRSLSLRPGRYFLRGRGENDLLEGAISVAANEPLVVDPASLRRVSYARLVRKGAGRGAARAVVLRAGGHSSVYGSAAPCVGGGAGYRVDSARYSLELEADGCWGGFDNFHLSSSTRELGGAVNAIHVWDLSRASVEFGAAVGATWMHQEFATTGVAPAREGGAAYVGVLSGVTFDVSPQTFVEVRATARTYFVGLQQGTEASELVARFAVVGTLGAGARF